MLAGIGCHIDASAQFVAQSCTDTPTGGLPKGVHVLVSGEATLCQTMPVYGPISAALVATIRTVVGFAAVDLHSFLNVEFLHGDISFSMYEL